MKLLNKNKLLKKISILDYVINLQKIQNIYKINFDLKNINLHFLGHNSFYWYDWIKKQQKDSICLDLFIANKKIKVFPKITGVFLGTIYLQL